MTETPRPHFPKRAVITSGMPYGNKELHFGHLGGMFIHADFFARFLRDRIGNKNVLFVSGTDCYGSPIVESHRQHCESGIFAGTLDDFVTHNHKRQSKVLKDFSISLDIYAASSFGDAAAIHKNMCAQMFEALHANKNLLRQSSPQFYDVDLGVYLNGRQVVGFCPVAGCKSEKAYADECALGHPYEPKELLQPTSALSGKTPELRSLENWYVDVEKFRQPLQMWLTELKASATHRPFVTSSIQEFLEPAAIYVKKEHAEQLPTLQSLLPNHRNSEANNGAPKLIFETLHDRDLACGVLNKHGIRFRTGKTLVPFRLTGNIAWGVEAPKLENETAGTFWVWPESLWAPISFTSTVLQQRNKPHNEWKKWWCCAESQVFQFIGEDNVFFYSIAEASMFVGTHTTPNTNPPEGEIRLPQLVVNNHILFFDKKASSSGSIKPPMAHELLDHYTSDQLRAHFLSLSLGVKSVGFKPKPLNPEAGAKDADPVLKDGNLLCNALNKAVRSCFYNLQKYFKNKMPMGAVTPSTQAACRKVILHYETLVSRHSFHEVMSLMDQYTHSINKHWTTEFVAPKVTDIDTEPTAQMAQALLDAFYLCRIATVLFHPIAPNGTEIIREYFNIGDEFWSWDRIFDPLDAFVPDITTHQFKYLEARVDFFPKHHSQITHGSANNGSAQ